MDTEKKPKSAQAKIKPPEQTFKVGDEEFRFRVGAFKSEGTTYTAEDALQNQTLLEKLVKKRSGLIKQIFS